MRPIHLFIIAILLGVLGLMWTKIVRAHDPYGGWTIPGTFKSCCNERDCRPTRARMDEREQWEAWDGQRWLKVPPDRVLSIPSPDGRSHVCISPTGVVLCFVPAPAMR